MTPSEFIFNCLLCFVLFKGSDSFVSAASTTAEPFFRNDYRYFKELRVFMKFVEKPKTWSAARSHCEAEGAGLAVIASEAEAKAVVDMLKASAPKQPAVWIGVHDIFIEDEFMTVNGDPASDYYFVWSPKQPDSKYGDEDCVGLKHDAKLNDLGCERKFPFVCKKEPSEVKHNIACGTYDQNYLPGVPNENQCYKLHLTPKNWSDALETCIHEQAKLAVINSEAEANIYKDAMALHPKDTVPGNFNKDVVLLGFHDRFSHGEYLTIDGIPLSNSGYEKWSPGQPDNANGKEHCGGMYRTALLNDVPCDTKYMFICEKKIVDPDDVGLYSRFQEQSQ